MDPRDSQERTDDLQSAITHHEAGRLGEAEQLYRQILASDPDEPDALNLLGVILQERGQLGQSIALISRALQLDPDFPEALANLARAQHAAGRHAEAAENATRATVLDPDLAPAHLIRCAALTATGESETAADAGRRAAALAPELFDAHGYLGLALEHQRDWPGAIAAYKAALALQPDRATMQLKLGAVLGEAGQYEEAIPYFRQATVLLPDVVTPFAGLGLMLGRTGELHGSIAAFARALELAPERADIWRMQGSNYDSLGRFDEAAAHYSHSLELNPESAEARRNLARIGRLANDEPEVRRLEGILADTARRVAERVAAGFALGTVLDRADDYDRAFAAFKAANDLLRALHDLPGERFDLDLLRNEVDTEIGGSDRASLIFAGLKGDPSELPVFIVGMPRSGTSLVEQIIASHPRAYGGGETMAAHDIIVRLSERQPGVHPLLLEPEAVNREATDYIAHLRAVAGDIDRVTEKLPDNVLALAHIAMMFPRARVIMCRRDLRDVCLSCYFQHFSDHIPWSLDLADCAARAREINRLMDHWRQAMPLRMLEVQYEALIADLEGQSRRLIAFLGLEWDPACLEFHKTERPNLTASRWQVRQPLYTSSVGRWRNYRKHLEPMLEGLRGLVPAEDEDVMTGAESWAAATPDVAQPDLLSLLGEDMGEAYLQLGGIKIVQPLLETPVPFGEPGTAEVTRS